MYLLGIVHSEIMPRPRTRQCPCLWIFSICDKDWSRFVLRNRFRSIHCPSLEAQMIQNPSNPTLAIHLPSLLVARLKQPRGCAGSDCCSVYAPWVVDHIFNEEAPVAAIIWSGVTARLKMSVRSAMLINRCSCRSRGQLTLVNCVSCEVLPRLYKISIPVSWEVSEHPPSCNM